MSPLETMMPEGITLSPTPQLDWVRVAAIYSVVLPHQPSCCSLVGRVTEVGPASNERTCSAPIGEPRCAAIDTLTIGDQIIAFGPVEPSPILMVDDCQKLANTQSAETMVFGALVLSLMPIIRLGQIEIGEQVLVLSNDCVGQLLANLAWLAGAKSCIAFDPAYTDSGRFGTPSQSANGLRWVEDLRTLEELLPTNAVDLLIDASGDPILFESNLRRIRNTGRVLSLERCHSAQFDFNVYPDLHRRSLKFSGGQLSTSLSILKQENKRQPSQLCQTLDFVQYLFQSERLQPATWSMRRLSRPDSEMLRQTLHGTKQRNLLIEW